MASRYGSINAIYRAPLTRSEKALLLYLYHRASRGALLCSPSIATIAADTSMHRQSVLTARQSLRLQGYLTWVKRVINSNLNDTTEYRLTWGGLVENETGGVGRKGNQRTYKGEKKNRRENPEFADYLNPPTSPVTDYCRGCNEYRTIIAGTVGYCLHCANQRIAADYDRSTR